jgi:ADP-heptose:LPS heptosyltransferase
VKPLAPSASHRDRRPRILVIRRDNIGDLVCTTPLLAALRKRYPAGYIAVLVNTYNRAVLDGNPDVDGVYAYEKVKHRASARSIVSVYVDRLRLIMALRREKFDYAILATPDFSPHSLRLARLIGARHVLGYAKPGEARARLDIALRDDRAVSAHQVEQVFGLLRALGINGPPPPLRVFPDSGERHSIEQALSPLGAGTPVVGVHISARRKRQQWPAASFARLIQAIATQHTARFLLLWAPGDASNPRHPGDDDKARAIAETCEGLPLLPCPTETLPRLIAALSLCDIVVCADGGAMHVAAALGKPILCFFGDSPPEIWHPWGVSYRLLRSPSRDVSDISVDEALAAYTELARLAPAVSRVL